MLAVLKLRTSFLRTARPQLQPCYLFIYYNHFFLFADEGIDSSDEEDADGNYLIQLNPSLYQFLPNELGSDLNEVISKQITVKFCKNHILIGANI